MYLCDAKHPSEGALIEHYNKDHAKLIELGLKLKKSKALRKQEKAEKAEKAANKIRLGPEQEPENNSSSDSDSSDGEHADTASNERQHDIFAPKNDDIDSGLEDLQELERIELDKRKALHNKREKRRLKRVNDNSDPGSDDVEDEDLSNDDNISYQNELDQAVGPNGT